MGGRPEGLDHRFKLMAEAVLDLGKRGARCSTRLRRGKHLKYVHFSTGGVVPTYLRRGRETGRSLVFLGPRQVEELDLILSAWLMSSLGIANGNPDLSESRVHMLLPST